MASIYARQKRVAHGIRLLCTSVSMYTPDFTENVKHQNVTSRIYLITMAYFRILFLGLWPARPIRSSKWSIEKLIE